MIVRIHPWVTCVALLMIGAARRVQSDDVQDLANKNGEFGLELYREIAKKTDDNIVISPFSLSTVLAMTFLGARENTKTEMSTVLKFTDVETHLHQSFKTLLELVSGQGDDYTLNIVNKIFGRKNYSFEGDYILEVEDYYYANLQKMDFQGEAEASRQIINKWVTDQTQEKIEDFLPPGFIDATTVMVLVNAVYFKGLWHVQFNSTDTVPHKFNLTETTSTDVKMMKLSNQQFKYGVDSDMKFRLLSMPYEGDEISFNIILPDDIEGLEELESTLTISNINAVLQNSITRKLTEVAIPKFKLSQKIDMVGIMQEMGIKDLFSSDADLSGISAAGNLYVSDVVHEAVLEINEEGTEAAAASGVGISFMSANPPPINFIADHPFMFFIRHEDTGSILFLGRYNGPPSGDNIIGKSLKREDSSSKAIHTVSSLVTSFVSLLLVVLANL